MTEKASFPIQLSNSQDNFRCANLRYANFRYKSAISRRDASGKSAALSAIPRYQSDFRPLLKTPQLTGFRLRLNECNGGFGGANYYCEIGSSIFWDSARNAVGVGSSSGAQPPPSPTTADSSGNPSSMPTGPSK